MNKIITKEDIYKFCHLTGDLNPIHLDKEYAKESKFGQIIAPGMYTASIIPAALVEKYGNGIIYASQTLNFKKPVYINTILEIKMIEQEVTEKFIIVETKCSVNDEIVLEGIAKIYVR